MNGALQCSRSPRLAWRLCIIWMASSAAGRTGRQVSDRCVDPISHTLSSWCMDPTEAFAFAVWHICSARAFVTPTPPVAMGSASAVRVGGRGPVAWPGSAQLS